MTTTSRAQAPRYEGVVDLRRYPINEPGSQQYRALVQACRDQLRDRGVAQLDGFLTPAAVSQMIAEAAGWRLGHGPATRPTRSTSSLPTIPRGPITRARCCSTRPRRPSPAT